jgi:hypothetical protein
MSSSRAEHLAASMRRAQTSAPKPSTGQPRASIYLILLCLAAAAALVALVGRFPLPVYINALFVASLVGLSFYKPSLGIAAVLAIGPMCSLAPWTGWLTLSEFDALIYAVLLGAGSRLWRHPPLHKLPLSLRFLGSLLLFWGAFSCLRNPIWQSLPDTNALQQPLSPWYGVYYFKALLYPALFWPILARLSADELQPRAYLGLLIGLTLTAVAAIFERSLFLPITQLAVDYRVLGPFPEMNVGSATLDGYLAFTVPFLAYALWAGRQHLRAIAAFSAPLVLTAFVLSFSRGLYVATAVALTLLVLLSINFSKQTLSRAALLPWLCWGVFFSALVASAVQLFQAGGYRALLTLCLALITTIASLHTPGLIRPARLAALVVGLIAAIAIYFLATHSGRGIYPLIACLSAFAVIAACLSLWGYPIGGALLVSLAPTIIACIVPLTSYWGGIANSSTAWTATLVLVFLWGVNLFIQIPTAITPSRVIAFLAATMVIGVLAIVLGNQYASTRFSASSGDLGYRQTHWVRSLDLLGKDPINHLIGLGSGRYFATRLNTDPPDHKPGTAQWLKDANGQAFVRLESSKIPDAYEPMRLAQRLTYQAHEAHTATITVRTQQATGITIALCEKWLIYPFNCQAKRVELRPMEQHWQTVQIPIPTLPKRSTDLVASQLQIFPSRAAVDLAHIQLSGNNGAPPLLLNPNFELGVDHWFTSSDHHHLPWQAQSLLLHVWIEQGLIGLMVASLFLLATSLILLKRRVLISLDSPINHLKNNSLRMNINTPVFTGLFAFLLVGLFDSLLDVPRIPVLIGLVLFITLPQRTNAP